MSTMALLSNTESYNTVVHQAVLWVTVYILVYTWNGIIIYNNL